MGISTFVVVFAVVVAVAIAGLSLVDVIRSFFVSLSSDSTCRLVTRFILPDICAGRCSANTNCVAIQLRRYGFFRDVQARRCACVDARLGGGPRQLPIGSPGAILGDGGEDE